MLLWGGLHFCLVIQRALRKGIEGSGLDTCEIECGVYAAATVETTQGKHLSELSDAIS